ncbi:MAG: 4Fe-4S dicluster domain [Clostridia bacterium]|nr:4Fe-4S dicluster domain [Clostridia bacterium]
MQRKTYFIDLKLCLKCKKCIAMEECPRKVIIKEEAEDPAYIGPGCSGCGTCSKVCVGKAIKQL